MSDIINTNQEDKPQTSKNRMYMLAAQCGSLSTIVKGFKDIKQIKPWIAQNMQGGKEMAKFKERKEARDEDPVYWVYYTMEEEED
jgi:tetrahydromethanopterin S-methyltransferase subunit C